MSNLRQLELLEWGKKRRERMNEKFRFVRTEKDPDNLILIVHQSSFAFTTTRFHRKLQCCLPALGRCTSCNGNILQISSSTWEPSKSKIPLKPGCRRVEMMGLEVLGTQRQVQSAWKKIRLRSSGQHQHCLQRKWTYDYYDLEKNRSTDTSKVKKHGAIDT